MNDAIKSTVSAVLPWLTAALPGAMGKVADAAIRGVMGISEEQDTVTALNNASPEQIVALKTAEIEFKIKAMEAGYKNAEALGAQEVEVIKTVNETMRVESSSEHWPSYSWRPFIGFSFGMYVNSLFMLPLFKVAPVVMSPDMVLSIGGILGVASWFRGKAQADVNNPISKG